MNKFTWLKRLYENLFTALLLSSVINSFNFLLRGVLVIVGMFAVAVGLKTEELVEQKTVSTSSKRKIQTFAKGSWCWIFGNDNDGINGDSGGDWKKTCDEQVVFGILPLLRKRFPNIPVIKWKDFLAKYWWLALRNPVNNLRLIKGISCEVNDCDFIFHGDYTVDDKYRALAGWQLVIAVDRTTNIPYFGFYCVFWWDDLVKDKIPFFKDRCFRLRAGYKIKPEYAQAKDNAKGMAFSFLPFRKFTPK